MGFVWIWLFSYVMQSLYVQTIDVILCGIPNFKPGFFFSCFKLWWKPARVTNSHWYQVKVKAHGDQKRLGGLIEQNSSSQAHIYQSLALPLMHLSIKAPSSWASTKKKVQIAFTYKVTAILRHEYWRKNLERETDLFSLWSNGRHSVAGPLRGRT